MATIPTGKGKSRITAAIVSGTLLLRLVKKIVVVFPSEILMKTDKKVLTNIEKLCNVKDVELDCIVGTKNIVYDDKTMYIVDECDYELFD